MSWLRKILVPFDATPNARAALRYAIFLGECFGASIDVIHFVQDDRSARDGAADRAALLRAHRAIAGRIRRDTAGKALRLRVRVMAAAPTDGLERALGDEGYDLLVVASEGALFGPSSDACARAAVDTPKPCGIMPVSSTVRVPDLPRVPQPQRPASAAPDSLAA